MHTGPFPISYTYKGPTSSLWRYPETCRQMVELRSWRLKLLQSCPTLSLLKRFGTGLFHCLPPACWELNQGSGAWGMSVKSHSKFMSDKQLISKAVQRIFFLPSTLWGKKNDANEIPQGGAACCNLWLILKKTHELNIPVLKLTKTQERDMAQSQAPCSLLPESSVLYTR